MIAQTTKYALISLAVGYIAQLSQGCAMSNFLTNFLKNNLITLLIELLAINSATMGIVLTKIRDLVESKGGASCFKKTRNQMIHSVKEQVFLILLGVVFLIAADSPLVVGVPNLPMLIQSCIIGVFVYSLMVLYDTAKSVLLIVDFDPDA